MRDTKFRMGKIKFLLGIVVIFLLCLLFNSNTVKAGEIVTITFKDENLYNEIIKRSSIIKETHNDETLQIGMYQENIEKVDELLYLNDCDITDISGLEYFTNLISLDISGNKIKDISIISKLDKLEALNVDRNEIESIEPVKNLTGLKLLLIGFNNIEDISPLKNLKNITSLCMDHNRITDISVLENLTQLEELSLSNNFITKGFEALDKLKGLERVDYEKLSNAKITKIADQIYTGNNITPDFEVIYNGDKLLKDIDYMFFYSDNKNEGKASVTVYGMGKYVGTLTSNFRIITKKSKMLELIPDKMELDIPEIEFEEATEIIENNIKDIWKRYNLSSDNINISFNNDFYNVEVNFEDKTKVVSIVYNNTVNKNNEDEQYVKNLKIDSLKYFNVDLSFSTKKDVYEQYKNIVNKYYENLINDNTIKIKVNYSIKENKTFLNYGKDIKQTILIFKNEILYDVRTFEDCIAVPTINVPDSINRLQLNEYVINLIKKQYNGQKEFENILLQNGTESFGVNITDGYTVKNGNDNLGYIIITKEAKDISKTTISAVTNKTYTGQQLKPIITIKDGNQTLKDGIDYKITYENNTKPGKATVIITGIGDYKGTTLTTFTILPKKVTVSAKTRTTSSITVKWGASTGATGYEIYYATSKNGKYKKLKTGNIRQYRKTSLTSGKTYYFKVRPYVLVDKTKKYGAYSSIATVSTTIKEPSITVKDTGTKVTIKWKKIKGISGYEIYMATSKNGKYSKIKTITNTKTIKYTKSSLKRGKTYYFKVRTFKIVNGKKIYSSYSSKKSARIIMNYTVKKNDNLTRLAKRFNTTVKKLISLNKIKKPNIIRPGQKLIIK